MVATLSADALEGTSPLVRGAIERLAALPDAPLVPKGVSKKAQAAVAVLLFQAPSRANSTNDIPSKDRSIEHSVREDDEFEPELHVICTTRALHLSSHPGQASLPGGKVDFSDRSVTETAFRETCEEVLLPAKTLRAREVVPLCVMRPFLSKTALIVHPVVFWLPPRSTRRTLASLHASPDEVSAVWSYPLRALLQSTAPRQIRKLTPVADGGQPQPIVQGEPLITLMQADQVDTHRPPQDAFRSYSEVPWYKRNLYRLHRFRSSHQLIKGLTADILIHVAAHAYRDTPFAGPTYDVHSASQPSWDDFARYIVQRTLSGAPREQSRWGDGESGDGYGSMERHGTHAGVDFIADDEQNGEAALQEARRRDLALTLRESRLDWSDESGAHYLQA